jgi:hypothetical protein
MFDGADAVPCSARSRRGRTQTPDTAPRGGICHSVGNHSEGAGREYPPLSDPRPAKRVRDPDLLRRLHLELCGEPCEICEERPGVALHHAFGRHGMGRKADDLPENLTWVCSICHDAEHGIRSVT